MQKNPPVFTGFSGGSFLLVAPMYIVEIAEPELRGGLASLSQLMLVLGIAYDNALSIEGAVGWNVISGILIAVPSQQNKYLIIFI